MGLYDSPLERGVGVCPLRFINTPLQSHKLRARSQGRIKINYGLCTHKPLIASVILDACEDTSTGCYDSLLYRL
jgi:hypothetical protein